MDFDQLYHTLTGGRRDGAEPRPLPKAEMTARVLERSKRGAYARKPLKPLKPDKPAAT